jgi:hypothetical protein
MKPQSTLFGKSDRILVQHQEELLRAARTFHDTASSTTGSNRGVSPCEHDSNTIYSDIGYADSGIISKSNSFKRQEIELYLSRNETPDQLDFVSRSGRDSSTMEQHLDSHEKTMTDCPAIFDIEFDNLCSRGLNKIAQKAIAMLDFPKAEAMLREALKHYKVDGLEDAHRTSIRTQLAICVFLQGNGSSAEGLVLDMAELMAEKDIVTRQLLYALALEQLHSLNYEATNRSCKLLWKACKKVQLSDGPRDVDIWRLLALSCRESGSVLRAEAMEEELPGLELHASLPSAVQFITDSEKLMVELFGASGYVQAQQRLAESMHLSETKKTSAFQRRQIEKLKGFDNGEVDNPGTLILGRALSSRSDDDASIKTKESIHQDGHRKRRKINHRFVRGVSHDLHEDLSFASSANIEETKINVDVALFLGLKKAIVKVGKRFPKNGGQGNDSLSGEKQSSIWKKLAGRRARLQPIRNEPDENGPCALSSTPSRHSQFPRGQTDDCDAIRSGNLKRSFSFGEADRLAEMALTYATNHSIHELPDAPLIELPDTSIHINPVDTKLDSVVEFYQSYFAPALQPTTDINNEQGSWSPTITVSGDVAYDYAIECWSILLGDGDEPVNSDKVRSITISKKEDIKKTTQMAKAEKRGFQSITKNLSEHNLDCKLISQSTLKTITKVEHGKRCDDTFPDDEVTKRSTPYIASDLEEQAVIDEYCPYIVTRYRSSRQNSLKSVESVAPLQIIQHKCPRAKQEDFGPIDPLNCFSAFENRPEEEPTRMDPNQELINGGIVCYGNEAADLPNHIQHKGKDDRHLGDGMFAVPSVGLALSTAGRKVKEVNLTPVKLRTRRKARRQTGNLPHGLRGDMLNFSLPSLYKGPVAMDGPFTWTEQEWDEWAGESVNSVRNEWRAGFSQKVKPQYVLC